MSCEDTTGILVDRLKGLSSIDDDRRLEAHLAACAACRAEADSVSEIWTEMAAADDEVPHDRMRARFHAGLAAYEARAGVLGWLSAPWRLGRPMVATAAAAALLIAGVLIGRGLGPSNDGEIAQLRAEVRTVGLALLEHQSASERLLGVAWAQRTEGEPQVVNALLERVQYDPSSNVRLAAVEALSAQRDRPDVVAGLAAALDRQDAPLLQVTLADALLDAGGDDGVAAVQRLLDREDLDPAVRDYLRTALQTTGAPRAQRPGI